MIATLAVAVVDMLADSIGLSWSIRLITDAALAADLQAVWRAVWFLSVVLLCRASLSAAGHYMESKVVEDSALSLRRRLFQAVMGGKAEYFDTHESGDVISRLQNDVETAKEGIRAFVNGTKQIYLIVMSITWLFIWSWPMAIGLVAMAGVSFLGSALVARPLRVTGQRYQETLAGVSESATNIFSGIAVIKSLRAQEEMGRRFGGVVDEHLKTARRRGFFMAIQNGVVMTVPFIGMGGMLLLAGGMVFRGRLTPGDATGLVQLCSRAFFPFGKLGEIWAGLQQNLAALQRVQEACAIPQEREGVAPDIPVEAPGGAPCGIASNAMVSGAGAAGTDTVGARTPDSPPAIEFRNVRFGYGSKMVHEGLSFAVPGGARAAIVGPSGSGKSTVFRLLLGMYDPIFGDILIGGRSVSAIPLKDLRSMIAVVPQEPWLIPGTVMENILIGRPDATEEEVRRAAEAANAAAFIEQLPDGYYTVLGERGGNLSGGERQRICLARAFLKDAPILLLDEPTSAVDAESERLIKQAVDALARGRTVITIAHTKAMVNAADVIVTLG
ncbi:MAG TPA: ABC transporter ATP-binding protein [Firmicutes bacterium]|nr:ABC transporter ATP-binding protein [Candidatus Fermentithermobacillaceae bacterium]